MRDAHGTDPHGAGPSRTEPHGAGPTGSPADDRRTPLTRRAFLTTAARRSGIVAGAFLLGLLIDTTWARAVRGLRLEREEYPKMVVGSWRVHHNVVGWALLALGLFRYPWVLVPLGAGMIVGHRIRDRLFWFIERVE